MTLRFPYPMLGSLAVMMVLSAVPSSRAQQVADGAFRVEVDRPAFEAEAGPVVFIDEAHGNFHTAGGRYAPFAAVLTADGFRVSGVSRTFTAATLAGADILVIANALHESNQGSWSLPTPSAFTAGEIAAVESWVSRGGSLWLIADHMPFPGAAADLAAVFGVEMVNGFALIPDRRGPFEFIREAGTLGEHAITRGRSADETVGAVLSFTGQAFQAPEANPLMILAEGVVQLTPRVAWQFDEDTPTRDVAGWLQGAVLHHGMGRVAIFGEAAMFTSQTSGGVSFGLSHPDAGGNTQFLLNTARWLAGVLQD